MNRIYGIILAAGKGNRLLPYTETIPKTLVEVINGKPMLEYIFAASTKYLSEMFVVGGYRIDKLLRKLTELSTKYEIESTPLFNPEYARKNNCYTLYVGLKYLKEIDIPGDICVINSDVIFSPPILKELLDKNKAVENSILVIDTRENLYEEDMKVLIKNNRIIKISKAIDVHQAFGEFIGISLIKNHDLGRFIQALEHVIDNTPHLYYEDAYQILMNEGYSFEYLSTNNHFWNEIDTVEDLHWTQRKLAELSLKSPFVL